MLYFISCDEIFYLNRVIYDFFMNYNLFFKILCFVNDLFMLDLLFFEFFKY